MATISVPTTQPSRRWTLVRKGLAISASVVAALLTVGWVGLQIAPEPFSALTQTQPPLAVVPLPAGLPAPVARFYRLTYGEQIPIITTAVVRGRGTLRFGGVRVPIRFRFTHEAGQNFRQELDLTWFGLPLFRGYDSYVDGHGRTNLPGAEEGAGFDQGSSVSLWASALNWFPAILVTDPRVRWEPVDGATALLVAPFGSGKEVLVVRFDPERGKVQYVEAMKYRAETGKQALWINGIWFDDGKPWTQLDVEDVRYNLDVHAHVRAEQP